MITPEVVLAVISIISAIVAGFWKYSELKLQEENKQKASELDAARTNTQFVVTSMLHRVEKLEIRSDELNDTIRKVNKEAQDEREKLIQAYEEKLDALRKEMKQLSEDNSVHLASWRDKYYALVQEYNKVKLEYDDLKNRFVLMEEEMNRLKAAFQRRRKTDTVGDIVESEDVTD
jgi:uncharacterized coiled-coil protein SlyX